MANVKINRSGFRQGLTLAESKPDAPAANGTVDLAAILARLEALETENATLKAQSAPKAAIRLSSPNKAGELKPLIVLDHGLKGWPVTVKADVAAWLADQAEAIRAFLADPEVQAELERREQAL